MVESEWPSATARPPSTGLSQTDMVLMRLCKVGVPMHKLDGMERGLLQFVKENKTLLQEVVSALMPGVEEAQLLQSDEGKLDRGDFMKGCREGVRWAEWLMFGGDPDEVMKRIQQETGHVRGVCGAVWGANDIAYRCRTCENDPTCAICVSCFESGNHVNHDYSMIHTGGGCCDCGDITAWKESGFCSQHNGTGQAPSLSEALMYSFESVTEVLLNEWGRRLQAASVTTVSDLVVQQVATETSLTMVDMLLTFCNCSESLLTCTSSLIARDKFGLLDLFLKSECFLPAAVLNKLHELLFKLMGNQNFKCQFAKTFIVQYPHFIRDGLKQNLESNTEVRAKESAALSSFSVQIFTVPILTLQLVSNLKLLDMLLESLKDSFLLCSGGDGQQLVSKAHVVSNFHCRIIDDIRFVLRHPEVADYVARERLDLLQAWLHLLAFTQGMEGQRRETRNHIEEETDNWFTAYFLEVQMAGIHPLLIDGTARINSALPMDESLIPGWSAAEVDTVHGHTKIGRTSLESDVSGKVGTIYNDTQIDAEHRTAGSVDEDSNYLSSDSVGAIVSSRVPSVPGVLLWLISESAKVLDLWFSLDVYQETTKSNKLSVPKGGILYQRGMHLRRKRGRATIRSGLDNSEKDVHEVEVESSAWFRATQGNMAGKSMLLENDSLAVKVPERGDHGRVPIDWWIGTELGNTSVNAEFVWIDKDWLEINFDVSQQEVSFHIPLHRFLAVALQKSLEASPNLTLKEGNKRSWHCQDHLITEKGFLLQLFPPCYQGPAFVSCLMEHPLRIQVFCAQVRAGMWRKNGHTVQALCDHYNSVKWCEGSLDLDLFLLQCCAVMAPIEDFVERIVSRFGLTEYFALYLLRPNEYETTLAQHMLAFLIRLVIERGFCGFSTTQACRRELIKRLAISDATHSQLMKALPPRLHEKRHWQEALLSVATYYKPSGMQQGRFSLRQDCWKELDLYHPRWNARDLQSAEDRYFRACKASSVVKQLPKWKKPFNPFQNLSRLATCKGVHDILRSIFFHAVFSEKLSESRSPENVLITALHLLALGLDVCSMFAYRKGLEYKSSGFEGGEETSSHSTQDTQEPPPLLGSATEWVYFGGVHDKDISNRQSLLSLLVLLMRRYSDTEAQGVAKESHLCSIGMLIKSLLEEFSKLHNGCMYEIESLAPEILHRVAPCQDEVDAVNRTDQLYPSDVDRKKLQARERQAAIMAKMKAAQEKFVASFELSEEQNNMGKEQPENKSPGCRQVNESGFQNEPSRQSSAAAACALCRDSSSNSSTSFLTFVQRSRLVEISDKGVPSWERRKRSKNVEALGLHQQIDNVSSLVDIEAQESQLRLMNLIQMALNGEVDRGPIEVEALLEFLGDNGFTDAVEGSQSSVDARMSETTSSDSGSDDLSEEENFVTSVELFNSISDHSGVLFPKDGERAHEDEKAKTKQSSLITVLLEYANVLARNRRHHRHQQQQQHQEAETEFLGHSQRRTSRLHAHSVEGLPHDNVGSNDAVGVHMSSCGHAVHQECLDRYLSSLVQRYHNRTLFEGLQIVDPNQGEFLCPVCRRLANSVLPYIPETFSPFADPATLVESVMQASPGSSTLASVSQVPQAMNLLCNAEELVAKSGFRKAVSRPLPKTLNSTFEALFWRLHGLYFSEKASNTRRNNNRISQSLLLWDVLRYTLVSVELAGRTQKDSFFSESRRNLEVLQKVTEKGCVLPVLLRAAKAIQNENRQSLLLMARGTQLIVGSICLGVSKDSISEPTMPGSVSKILQFLDNVKEVADVSLWRRAADPILAHDPFSSLFWIVFCLPLSSPLSAQPFIALVHLLYLVCIFQILILMGDRVLKNLSELQLNSGASAFIHSVMRSLAGMTLFPPIHDQASGNSSGSMLLDVRRFTLPFLRRCALLGKLLCNLTFEEMNDEAATAYVVQAQRADASIKDENCNDAAMEAFQELKELEILEKTFRLPSLQNILEREDNQDIVKKWVLHLSKDLVPRKLLPLSRPTMAAPFKLMDLPRLYQTLLQHYIREQCPNCLKVPEQPALCLLCGTFCCGFGRNSRCSGNRQSGCFRHAMSCNGGVGVFLMIKRTNILLQRCARQAYWPSPYLDSFGEEDIDMHRGKPLYLSEERYAALTAMVVAHGLDHSSLVLSQTTWEAAVWG